MGLKAWDWSLATEDFQLLVNEGLGPNGCQQKVATDGLWLKCCKEKLGTEVFYLKASNWMVVPEGTGK